MSVPLKKKPPERRLGAGRVRPGIGATLPPSHSHVKGFFPILAAADDAFLLQCHFQHHHSLGPRGLVRPTAEWRGGAHTLPAPAANYPCMVSPDPSSPKQPLHAQQYIVGITGSLHAPTTMPRALLPRKEGGTGPKPGVFNAIEQLTRHMFVTNPPRPHGQYSSRLHHSPAHTRRRRQAAARAVSNNFLLIVDDI